MTIPLLGKKIPDSLMRPGKVSITITNNVPQNPGGREAGDSTPPPSMLRVAGSELSITEYIRHLLLGDK